MIASWTQRAADNSLRSRCCPITDKVPQGVILELIEFIKKNHHNETRFTLCNFQNNTKLGRVAATLNSKALIQNLLEKLED